MDKLNELLTQLRKLGFEMDCDGPDEEKEDFYIGSIGNLCVTVSLMREEEEPVTLAEAMKRKSVYIK